MAEAAALQRTEDAKNGVGLLSRFRGLFGKPAAAEADEGGQGDDDEKKKGGSTWWRLKPVTLLCLAVLVGALVVRIWDPDFVEGLRVKTFDLYQRLEPRPVKPYPVAIIDIDEKSLAEIGQWPWSRSVIGNLIAQATKQGAAVVGFDVVFAEYDRMSPKTAAASFSGLSEEIKKALEALPSNEAVMVAAMKRARVVVGQVGNIGDLQPGQVPPPKKSSVGAQLGGNPKSNIYNFKTRLGNVPELENAAAGHGLFSIGRELDGVVRRVPMVYAIGKKIYPALSLEMLRVAFSGRTILTKKDQAGMKSVVIQGRSRANSYEVPTDRNGRIWVHYSKPDVYNTKDNSGRLYVSAVDVLKGRLPKGKLKGKLAIVGPSAAGLLDIRATPITPQLPGVEVHANILETIFASRGEYDTLIQKAQKDALANMPAEMKSGYEAAVKKAQGLQRARKKIPPAVMQPIQVAQKFVNDAVAKQRVERPLRSFFLRYPNINNSIEMALILVFGIAMIILIPRVSPVWTLVGLVVAGGALVTTTWFLYTDQRILLDVTYPGTVTIAVYSMLTFANYARDAAEKRQVRNSFGMYLSPALVEQLADNPDQLQLGGETKEMTFLFCDVRGFTTISEQFKTNPHGLTDLINRLLTPLTNNILERSGTIDKYMGDCIMAFWNAPLTDREHALHACESSLAMFDSLDVLNAEREEEAKEAGIEFLYLNVGVGINTGECVVGNMGSEQRFDYSVLGDPVNLAARLEGQSKNYGVKIVLGDDTAKQAGDGFAIIELDEIAVKGKTEAVRIHALLGDAEVKESDQFQRLATSHTKLLDAYRGQNWDEVTRIGKECREIDPDLFGLYDMYDERIEYYTEFPPSEDWDGVFVATFK